MTIDTSTSKTEERPLVIPKIVVAIKPPAVDPEEKIVGDTKVTTFYITYVTSTGQQVTAPCTADVYRWQTQDRPESMRNVDWIINTDKQGVVQSVVRKPHLRQGPLSTRFNTNANDLMLVKSGQAYEPVNLPMRFDPHTLDEAMKVLSEAGGVKPGDKIGRFVVKQTLADSDEVYVVLDFAK